MQTNKYIDHTLLKAFATKEDIKRICEEAIEYNFMSVCVNPVNVAYAASLLKGKEPVVCTVIGFPLGANTSEVKAYEAEDAILNGASEIDMVINVGAMKAGDYDTVREDIEAVRDAVTGSRTLKVIIETCYLTKEEIVKACELAVEAGADFVKTSTGFGTGGATPEDVKLMYDTVNGKALVKASGGVHNKEEFDQMVEAGASRIGASSGVQIMKGETSNSNY